MKVVILAGGLGSRLSEKTGQIPKPMIEVGGQPILCHIMESYASCGFDEFVVAAGYKAEVIERYFLGHSRWKVDVVDTGLHTQTGGRLKRLNLQGETFMMTYGDGLCDVDIADLLEFHKSHGKRATLTAVHPPARFGKLSLNGTEVAGFSEKAPCEREWINGGFFVLEPSVLDTIAGDGTIWEKEPVEGLVREGELCAYRHEGFWHPMDTLKDYHYLESIWREAPWIASCSQELQAF